MNAYYTSSISNTPLQSGLPEDLDRLAQQILYRVAFPKGKVKGMTGKSITPKGKNAGSRGMEKSAVSATDLQDAWQIICAHLSCGTHEKQGAGEIFASVRKTLHANNNRRQMSAIETAAVCDVSFSLWKGCEALDLQRARRKALVSIAKAIHKNDTCRTRKARLAMAIRPIFGVWESKNGQSITKEFIKSYYGKA